MEKIITAIFNVESEGFQAMTELKNAPARDTFFVSQAVLIKKMNGKINVLDSFDTGYETSDDTAKGGLIGALIGILGGPIGILIGGGIGMLAGSTIDAEDTFDNASLLERMTEVFVDGEIGLMLLEQESEDGAAQKYLSKFDVSVTEEDAAEVAAEVRHAAEVQKQMEKEARKQLRAEKKEDRKQSVAEHREKIKADFEDKKAAKAAKKAEKKAEKEAKKAAKAES